MLEFKNVTKKFGSVIALQDIGCKVDEGEFLFITGPSGSGKTTLLRLILRELKPDEGEIFFDGESTAKISNKQISRLRQKIGVVFQDFKVLPERTVRENVEVALAVIGLPGKEWNARVNHVLELVGLDQRSNFFPSQLAGGELQRVSMARALVVNPKIILADEPTGNLDWETADNIMGLFEKINKEGKTVIMATHNKLIVDNLKKRTIELKDGKITSDSKPKKEEASDKSEEVIEKEKDQNKKEKKKKD
jgi:cell division transport system ATP-binding protein